MGTLVALRRVEQNELLNLTQLLQELIHGDSIPGSLGLFMKVLQQRDAKHAIEGMDANLAIGPVIHGSPAQPVSILQSPKDSLDILLTGVAQGHLLGGPIHTVGEQHRAAQTVLDESLPGDGIKVKLEPPLTLVRFELIANQLLEELTRANVGSCCEFDFPSSGRAVYSGPWPTAARLAAPC